MSHYKCLPVDNLFSLYKHVNILLLPRCEKASTILVCELKYCDVLYFLTVNKLSNYKTQA